MQIKKMTFLLASLLLCWSGVMAKYALNVSCSNQITAIANGDSGPYYFNWIDPSGKIINPTNNKLDRIKAYKIGTYSVIFTNKYGCETILDVLIGYPSCKLANTQMDNSLSIYPNPFSNGLLVDFESEIDTVSEIQVTDLSGKVLYEERISSVSGKNSHQISLSQDLSKGIYMLKLKLSNEPVQTVKLIKE